MYVHLNTHTMTTVKLFFCKIKFNKYVTLQDQTTNDKIKNKQNSVTKNGYHERYQYVTNTNKNMKKEIPVSTITRINKNPGRWSSKTGLNIYCCITTPQEAVSLPSNIIQDRETRSMKWQ